MLGNGRSCEELGVETVEVDLDNGFITEEALCRDGSVLLRDVPVGAYDVVVYGYDRDGIPILDSAAGEPVPASVFTGTTTTSDPVLLTSAPARLFVRWGFMFSDCQTEGIDHFVVRAWHEDGTQLLNEQELPCSMPGEGAGRYRQVPDPERALVGDVFGEVSAQPVDEDGVPAGDPVRFMFEPPGAGYRIEISLRDCTASGCEGSGELD